MISAIKTTENIIKVEIDPGDTMTTYHTFYCVVEDANTNEMILSYNITFKSINSQPIEYKYSELNLFHFIDEIEYESFLPYDKEFLNSLSDSRFYCSSCNQRIYFSFKPINYRGLSFLYTPPIEICPHCHQIITQQSISAMEHGMIYYQGAAFDKFLKNPFHELSRDEVKIGQKIPFGRYDFVVTQRTPNGTILTTKNTIPLQEIISENLPKTTEDILKVLNSIDFLSEAFSRYENSIMAKNTDFRTPTLTGISYFNSVSQIDKTTNKSLYGGIYLMSELDTRNIYNSYAAYTEQGLSYKKIILDLSTKLANSGELAKVYDPISQKISYETFEEMQDFSDYGVKLVIGIPYDAISDFKNKLIKEVVPVIKK